MKGYNFLNQVPYLLLLRILFLSNAVLLVMMVFLQIEMQLLNLTHIRATGKEKFSSDSKVILWMIQNFRTDLRVFHCFLVSKYEPLSIIVVITNDTYQFTYASICQTDWHFGFFFSFPCGADSTILWEPSSALSSSSL